MQFQRIEPPLELKKIVECYWIATNTSPLIHQQKIIPDGFPEIIFHFGKSYKINLSGNWKKQTNNLLAGQLTKYFFLENTGLSDILGIKLQPSAVFTLLGVDSSMIKDKVVDISSLKSKKLNTLKKLIRTASNHSKRIEIINCEFQSMLPALTFNGIIEKAVESIFSSHGMTSIMAVADLCEVSERQLERLFKTHIGLSPKLYARIIRFSHIFQVMQKQKISWTQVGLESGFYDQAHFIRNFKTFTGEDPTKYFFDKPTMANFFLKKS